MILAQRLFYRIEICILPAFTVLSLLFAVPVFADSVTLKTGETLENVMVVSISQTIVTVKFQNGNIIEYSKTQVQSLRRRPVEWPVVTEPEKIDEKPKAAETEKPNEIDKPVHELPPIQQPVLQQEAINRQPTARGALLRSAILPGWGQLYQGRNYAGAAFIAATILGIRQMSSYYGSYTEARRGYNASSQYMAASLVAPSTIRVGMFAYGLAETKTKQGEMSSAVLRFNLIGTFFIGLYVWNFVDIYRFTPSQTVTLGGRGDSFQVAFRWDF